MLETTRASKTLKARGDQATIKLKANRDLAVLPRTFHVSTLCLVTCSTKSNANVRLVLDDLVSHSRETW